MKLRDDITLGPPDPFFTRRAEEEGWLDDEELNHVMGWGRGLEGRVKARRDLLSAAQNGFLVVYRRGEPVGWMTIEEDPESREILISHLILSTEASGEGVGAAAVALLLDRAFRAGAFRVAVSPLAINREAIHFFGQMGFRSEGKLRGRVWMEDEPHGVAVLAILKPEWKAFKKDNEIE